MRLSPRYSHLTVQSAQRPGGPVNYNAQIMLTAALEVNMAGSDVDSNRLTRPITTALNHYAGGQRNLRGQPYQIVWSLRWVDRLHVIGGTALGVSVLDDAVFGNGEEHTAGMT